MGNFFLRFFLIVLLVIASAVVFLTYFGLETDRFDNLIKNKTNEINQNVKLEFQKTKIHLNLKELNLVVKLQNPKILVRSGEIDLSKLDLFLSIKSFFSSDFLLKRAEIAFIRNDIKDLTKISNIFLPRLVNKQLNKIFEKGNLEGEFIIPFESDGNIGKDYGFSGKISDASINFTKEFSIKNLTTEIIQVKKFENNGFIATIKKGSITGIIGPNGSGKTTLFNLTAGNLRPSIGNVLFQGENITGIPSYELFSKGLLRTFQIAHEFTNLTVLENLMMVPGNQSGEQLTNALFNPKIVNEEEKKIKDKALEVIKFLNLTKLSQELAGNLSGGQKKLLELGRTMMVDAKLVLLDEVGAGVNRTLLKDIGSAILRLNKEKGYTFCMIEHDMDFINRLCDPVIVMSEGSILFKGTSNEVKNNEQVIESYLGRGSKIRNGSG